ncbi:related to sirtuin 5 and related class III sirtuins (SIR2 family) [Ramularia collo-cygni]|uniref:Related to sirtuin 5 and related class III sirtuins (SIR2 family) n=1 Tax=Ramularia collo-cygni TaxID=112498 RepID=A0A2D3VBL9_9PEZI|nr:related to sirtuin 5 and related class III sirtuins (SIR2 family) [Ramularia collo-cygni]CZT21086.1 related to sirtuin 5 and related class III sirtuins (SIR2 family) [Ramularia collo-cygni]
MAFNSPSQSIDDFHALLSKSTRVLALLGAGLSASSGLPTFRGAGGLWRSHDAMSLATPEAFAQDPVLVWRFYSYRRHMALSVEPNPAHYALAELAKKMPGFMTLSQNVDGLSTRAGHQSRLQLLHGTLFEVKCNDWRCDYVVEDFNDPICPALDLPDGIDPTTDDARSHNKKIDISDPAVKISDLDEKDLPHCPRCKSALLRPAVVWFGEDLSETVLDNIDAYLGAGDVDLIMVIGTGAKVYPAAGYITRARDRGARVCVVNVDSADAPPGGWADGDFLFQGDAAHIVPELLRPVTGELSIPTQARV